MSREDRRTALKRCAEAALLCGGAVVVGFMIFSGEPSAPLWWLGFVLFAIWGLVPFVVAKRVVDRHAAHERALWVLLSAAIVLGAGTFAILRDAFVVHPDAQSGILFVLLPAWQLIALIPFFAAARWLGSTSQDA